MVHVGVNRAVQDRPHHGGVALVQALRIDRRQALIGAPGAVGEKLGEIARRDAVVKPQKAKGRQRQSNVTQDANYAERVMQEV